MRNLQNLKTKGPVIIAMNHPNAFTDPIFITYLAYPQRLNYMARGDAFKPGPAAWLLEQIGLVPIFRIQDAGKEGLLKNDDSYRRINALLKKNAKVIVFAEGLCIQERRLRPLKKGVARMVFGAYDALKNDELLVLPVGVNYSHPNKFRSEVFYNIGEPIHVKDFIAEYRAHPARAQKQLLGALEPAMKDLITHIESKESDEAVFKAEELVKHSMILDAGMDPKDPWHDFTVLKKLTERVNAAAVANPEMVKSFTEKATAYFDLLHRHRLKDWLLDPSRSFARYPNILLRIAALLPGLPIYLTGMTTNYPPLWLTEQLTRKLVKTREFFSSFALGFGMVIFTLWYLLLFFVIYCFSPGIFLPLAACTIFAFSGWFSLWYHRFLLNTMLMLRYLRRKSAVKQLQPLRAGLVAMINKF